MKAMIKVGRSDNENKHAADTYRGIKDVDMVPSLSAQSMECIEKVEGMPGWHSIDVYPEARELPGITVYRWEAPLFFANSGIFRQQVRRLVREQKPSWVVLRCEAVTDIDITAAAMLKQLDDELNTAGVHLAFAELRGRLQERVLRYGLFDTLDEDRFYPMLKAAVWEVERLGPLPAAPEATGGGHRHRRRSDGEPKT
jgi:MFS superfamily sulfate permease-like transporter